MRAAPSLRGLAPCLLAAAVLLAAALPAAADIYQWVDDQGTIHFTDELSAVPPAARGKARPVQREAPITIEAPPPGAYGPPPAASEAPLPDDSAGDPATQAEALRAKITAKEQLIESVDRTRSLTTNPLRNRMVNPADMDLYRKYQAELPADRERLKELESRIDSLTR